MIGHVLRACFVALFNGAVMQALREGRLSLAELPAFYGWMNEDWPAAIPNDFTTTLQAVDDLLAAFDERWCRGRQY